MVDWVGFVRQSCTLGGCDSMGRRWHFTAQQKARISADLAQPDLAMERLAAVRLLRRYGRSRTGLLGARVPQWRPDDGFQPCGWSRSRWEDRLIFCIDVETELHALRSVREQYVLLHVYALDGDRRRVCRDLNLCYRTLIRILERGLDHFAIRCRSAGIEF